MARRVTIARLLTVAAVVALAFSASALTGCGGRDDEPTPVSDLRTATVVRLTDTDASLEAPELVATHRLPAGSIVEVDASSRAAVRSVTGLPHPLQRFSLLDLKTGSFTTLLDQAVGHDAGYDIVDVRVSDSIAVWLETDMTSGAWRVFAADLPGSTLGSPLEVAFGGAGTLLPSIGVSGNDVLWLVAPDPEAAVPAPEAVLYALLMGSDGEPRTLFTSASTVSNPLTVAGRAATVVERARVGGVRQSTVRAFDIDTDKEVASLAVPAPINPSDATYLNGRFTFSVPARYDGVGPLGDVGTYLQIGSTEFIRITRQPMDTPAFVSGRFVSKVGRGIVVVEGESKTHVELPSVDKLPDYGEYLASNGIASSVVTFTSPEVGAGQQPYTVVQVYSY